MGLLLSFPSAAYFGSGFAEPFSATLTLTAVACASCAWIGSRGGRPMEPWRWRRLSTLVLLAVAVALAVRCKREALAVTAVLVPAGVGLWLRDLNGTRGTSLLVALAALLGSGHRIHARWRRSAVSGCNHAGGPVALFVANITRFLPAMLGMLVRTPSAVVAVVLSGVALATPGTRRLAAASVGIAVVYVTAFLAFDQDYATVVGGEVPDHHFARYALQVAPLMCMVAGLGGAEVARRVRARWPALAASPLDRSVGVRGRGRVVRLERISVHVRSYAAKRRSCACSRYGALAWTRRWTPSS